MRTTKQEFNYYGSDLNKFIDENCTHKMTAINIDTLMYKRTERHIRIIESKHRWEDFPDSQEEILKLFAKFTPPRRIKFGVFIVRGDEPYDDVLITDLMTGTEYKITDQKTFIRWLNFKLDLDDDENYED